jgi:pimeloyl-ACP methyl ester carboxylesterase
MRRTVALAVLAAGCSGAGGDERATSASPTSSPPTTYVPRGEIDALFDVGGHKLHLYCKGSGSPTVVYLHGHSQQPGDASGASAGALPTLVADKGHRFCGYDRANTGTNDKVPGPLDGKTTLADLHGLLQAAEIEPPYVLVGASFGGLFAYMYAVTYPKEVEVESPHHMEAAVPERIVQELEKVIAKA